MVHAKGVEIGVFEGDNSSALLDTLPLLNLLVCVDPYIHYPAFDEATPNKSGKVFNADFREVEKTFRLRMKKFSNRYTLIKECSDDASRYFDDETFDFIFIDGNHAYEFVLRDIQLWVPKVKPGGLIAGHDFVNKPGYGVIAAVKESFSDGFMVNRPSKVWYTYKPKPEVKIASNHDEDFEPWPQRR